MEPKRKHFRKILTLLCIHMLFSGLSPLYSLDDPVGFYLSEKEKNWLKEHPVIRIAPDPVFPPIEFFDGKGEFRGMSADYLTLLEEIIPVRFELIHTESWQKSMVLARSRQADMYSAAVITEPRTEYMSFSPPYMEFEAVILINNNSKAKTLTLEDLRGQDVLIPSGYYIHEILEQEYPEINLIPRSNLSECLRALALGDADAFIGNISTISYHLEEEGITNLRLAGRTGMKLRLSFAVRNDWPEFLIILTKAMEQISEEERTAIYSRWIHLEDTALNLSRRRMKILSLILLSFLFVLILILMWNRSLKMGIARKTEELKRYEEAMIQARKMETIAKMSSGIAHDFNNVLSGMNSAVNLMELDLTKSESISREKLIDYISMLKLSGNRAGEIVGNLLSLARKQEMSFVPLDLNRVIRNVVMLCTPNMDKSVHIKCRYSDRNATVMGDSVRLEQVILNLCINAEHAMTIMKNKNDRGGLLELTLDLCSRKNPLGTSVKIEEYWMISVRDTGVGIEDEQLKNIFTPFYTTKKNNKGTGLGLSMSYNTVIEHSGFIEVHSAPGKGSRFEVYLPAIKDI